MSNPMIVVISETSERGRHPASVWRDISVHWPRPMLMLTGKIGANDKITAAVIGTNGAGWRTLVASRACRR